MPIPENPVLRRVKKEIMETGTSTLSFAGRSLTPNPDGRFKEVVAAQNTMVTWAKRRGLRLVTRFDKSTAMLYYTLITLPKSIPETASEVV